MITFDGAAAVSTNFDASRLSSLVANRNSRFILDLSNKSFVEVLKSSEMFHKRINPKYKNSAIVNIIKKLEAIIGQEIMPIDITDEFYVELKEFLLGQKNNRGTSIKPSTIKTYFNTIQATLNWASKHKAAISETYNVWKVENYEGSKVALTPSQIAHLFYFDIAHNIDSIRKFAKERYKLRGISQKAVEAVRDHFVLSCQLGQRFSDTKRINPDNFDITKTVYRTTQQKTGGKAVVNIAKYAIEKDIAFSILEKYNYQAPCFGKDINVYNRILHTICHCAGRTFNDKESNQYKVNGELKTDTKEVWELVSSHTARRTFVTYWAANEKMSTARLQRCTGHKDIRQISRYTIIKDED